MDSFTGQDQNVQTGSGGTGVYDFLFRKYDPSAGRWMSPDPAGWAAVDLTNPQSLSRYAYVSNMPGYFVDPYGQYMIPCPDPPNGTVGGKSGAGSTENDPGYTIRTYGCDNGVDTSDDPCANASGGCGPAPYTYLDGFGYLPSEYAATFFSGGGAPNYNCTNGVGTGGVGVGAGYNADLGAGAAGASSTGGGSGGLFHNSGGGFSGGLFGSGGAAAYFGSHMAGAPSQTSSSFVLGGYAGAGASFFFTNAGGVQQLGGPFTTVSVNVGVGIANLGVQLSFGGGIWQLGITPPIASVGIGAAGSVIRTNTITTHAGCH
ncbi:MAG TPA: RHS repeat-associated core domain-containing protein [Terracidiphilus sp.]|nr:RHS repeat-associated core domain-containing protein [Terracidiphilus sp.]